MATLLEEMKTGTMSAVEEAQRHNALIKERYRRLQDAEADQFAEETHIERNATNYTVRASVLAPEAPVIADTPVFEQAPMITEFVHERVESPVFTTEKFNAIEREQTVAEVVAPTPVEMPTQAPVQATATEVEVQYGLSRLAKTVMAAFAATVTLMLCLIGVNSNVIRQKSVRLQELETQNQELMIEYQELQARIQQATSQETIMEYVQEEGMIPRAE